MINSIVTAYRAQIYDRSVKDMWTIVNNDKKLWIVIITVFSVVIGFAIAGVAFDNQYLTGAAFVIEIVAIIAADRFAVSRYRRALERRQEHLTYVVEFLQTTVPGVDLCNKKYIDEVIIRLTDYVEEKRPFSRLVNKLTNFAKSIIIPVITYIAGVCAGQLQEIDADLIVTYGIGFILLAATVWLAMSVLRDAIKPILCRDYDAAVSLREDLKDLQLLRFYSKNL